MVEKHSNYGPTFKDYVILRGEGIIIPVDLITEKNEHFKKKFDEFLQNRSINTNLYEKEYNSEIIRNDIANTNALCLEITQRCNINCRYCYYGGNYLDQRRNTGLHMSQDTAFKAVDFFFNWIESTIDVRKSPMNFQISFYGGEPTLNFGVLSETVEYTKHVIASRSIHEKFNTNLIYVITTNGVGIEDKIKYLIKNNFHITFSLDGPKEIHDLNRGRGTFDKTYEVLKYIYNNDNNFFKNHISINTVYSPETDLRKVSDFFSSEMFENVYKITVLEINRKGLLNKSINNEISDYTDFLLYIKRKIAIGAELSKIEKAILGTLFNFSMNTLRDRKGTVPGAWCTPGSAMFYIAADGGIFSCEKVSRSFLLGSVNAGLDFEYIKKLNNKWFASVNECMKCDWQSSCLACLANVGLLKKFEKKDYCEKIKQNFVYKIGEYIKLNEKRARK